MKKPSLTQANVPVTSPSDADQETPKSTKSTVPTTLDLPRQLHRALKGYAGRQGVTLGALLVRLLTEANIPVISPTPSKKST